jgi:hypothetical protein
MDRGGRSWADFQAPKPGHEPVLGTRFLATTCLQKNSRGPTRMASDQNGPSMATSRAGFQSIFTALMAPDQVNALALGRKDHSFVLLKR